MTHSPAPRTNLRPLRASFLMWLIVSAVPAGASGAGDPPPGDGPSKPAAAAALRAGSRVGGTLESRGVGVFPLDAGAGDYVLGRFDGPRMRVTLLRDGERERVLIPKGGRRQEFMFVVGDRSTRSLEIVAESAGPFTLAIERVVPPSAQVAPAEVLESPRLRRLQQTLISGGKTDDFWRETEAKKQGPLVERDDVRPPLAGRAVLVTFLWRGAKNRVRLFGAPSNDHDDMKRLGDSDVWYGSYRVPDDARIAYKLAPDVPVLDAPAMVRRRAILATARRDPLNPRSFPEGDLPDQYAGESLLELPRAARPPWLERRPGASAGAVEPHRVESKILGNVRDVQTYRPHGYRAGAEGNALLVVFDGDRYVDDIQAPLILDNLIAARAIPMTAAVFIGNPSGESRSAELPPNPKFARFLAEELMPWARLQAVDTSPARTVIAGASYGGLAAAYAGWMHPELFGNVFSQSGSFWWAPAGDGPEAEPEWLARRFVESAPRPVRFYLEAGRFEVGHTGTAGILDTTRHLRDVLKARGYTVHHAEPAGAHGYAYWRYTLADGLVTLLGKPPSPAHDGGGSP